LNEPSGQDSRTTAPNTKDGGQDLKHTANSVKVGESSYLAAKTSAISLSFISCITPLAI
jgi:hypothetical protein